MSGSAPWVVPSVRQHSTHVPGACQERIAAEPRGRVFGLFLLHPTASRRDQSTHGSNVAGPSTVTSSGGTVLRAPPPGCGRGWTRAPITAAWWQGLEPTGRAPPRQPRSSTRSGCLRWAGREEDEDQGCPARQLRTFCSPPGLGCLARVANSPMSRRVIRGAISEPPLATTRTALIRSGGSVPLTRNPLAPWAAPRRGKPTPSPPSTVTTPRLPRLAATIDVAVTVQPSAVRTARRMIGESTGVMAPIFGEAGDVMPAVRRTLRSTYRDPGKPGGGSPGWVGGTSKRAIPATARVRRRGSWGSPQQGRWETRSG